MGPLTRYSPAGTTIRPPPASRLAVIAAEKAALLSPSPSAEAPKSLNKKSRSGKTGATMRARISSLVSSTWVSSPEGESPCCIHEGKHIRANRPNPVNKYLLITGKFSFPGFAREAEASSARQTPAGPQPGHLQIGRAHV